MAISDQIKARIEQANGKYWASDNISEFLQEGDKEALIDELTPKFESVLDSLVIDRRNDPNSQQQENVLLKCT